MYYENFDLQNIVTPVNVAAFTENTSTNWL